LVVQNAPFSGRFYFHPAPERASCTRARLLALRASQKSRVLKNKISGAFFLFFAKTRDIIEHYKL
jgi:hypothetical protein